ncbi:hypothetical protein LN650_31995 [Klebsiella pneumoniae subsp. pneumoniae]|nr:hypothetical protein [Klebsiella pneumoniae subsp. pneumoniae]
MHRRIDDFQPHPWRLLPERELHRPANQRKKTGIAASVTGFIQTVSAGAISYFAVKLTDTGMGFDRTLGMSTLTLAILSLLVVTTMKVTQWKTGKKRKIDRSLKYQTEGIFRTH